MLKFLLPFCIIVSMTVSAEVCAAEITLIVELQNQSLSLVGRANLQVPQDYSGYYITWTNEREFISRQMLVEGRKYRVAAQIIREETGQFPENWGARSGKYFLTYHVEAVSVIPLEENSP
jgi:hypothetical protein